jgi:hypothetical protein
MVSDDSGELRIWPTAMMNDGGGTSSAGERYGHGWNEPMRGMGVRVNRCAHGHFLLGWGG